MCLCTTDFYVSLSGASKGTAKRGACKKCGEIGHLAFQCFNMLSGKKQQVGDVSSTSSDFDEEEELKREKRERENSVSTGGTSQKSA